MYCCLAYKDTKAVHRAMFYGTIVVGAMMIGMHLIGVLSRGILTDIDGSTDRVMPVLIATYMNPVLAGITITGPLAATMSTISSLLISGSSAIVKDIYLHHVSRENKRINQKTVGRISVAVTAVMGAAAVLLSINPPSLIVWINLFAFGGLQAAFFWVFLLGLFWHKANKTGALFCIVGRPFVLLRYNSYGNKNRSLSQYSNRHRCRLYMLCNRQSFWKAFG